MKYNNHLNYRDRKRFLFRVRLAIFFVLMLLIIGAIYMYVAIYSQSNKNTDKSTTSEATTGYFAPAVKIFRSPYFQFQTGKTWVEVPAESTPTKYVYRSLRSDLIEHELIIYVNQIPANIASNRVFPVNLNADSTEFQPSDVSEHCIKAFGGVSRIGQPEALLDRVKFKCAVDSTNYTVQVGLVDGTTILTLRRPDTTTAAYAIFYSNLTANPEPLQLKQIIESFQTR